MHVINLDYIFQLWTHTKQRTVRNGHIELRVQNKCINSARYFE